MSLSPVASSFAVRRKSTRSDCGGESCIVFRFNSQARVHTRHLGLDNAVGIQIQVCFVYGEVSAAPVGLSGASLIAFHRCGTSPAIRNSHTILDRFYVTCSHPPFASVTSFLTLKYLLQTLCSALYLSITFTYGPIVELL